MKDIHRSEKLDAFIGRSVRVYFTDGSRHEGILGFSEKLDINHGYRAGEYYLNKPQGAVIFRKTHVKKILPIGGPRQ